MSERVDLSDFVSGFLIEAEEHLHATNLNLIATANALKQQRPEPRAVRDLFRSLHTIKGLAAMVGAESVVDVAHEMEGLLRTADRAGGRLTEPGLDLIARGTRALEERIDQIRRGGLAALTPAPKNLIETLLAAQAVSPSAPSPADREFSLPPEMVAGLSVGDREQMVQAALTQRRVVLIDFAPSLEKAATGLNITSVRQRLVQLGDLVKVVPRSAPEAPSGIAFSILLVTAADDPELIAQIGGDAKALHAVSEVSSKVSSEIVSEIVQGAEPQTNLIDEDDNADFSNEQSSIRVDVRRLDEALEQLSGLFVTRFKLERAAAQIAAAGDVDVRDLRAVIAENTRQLRRLRTAISEARMVRVSELLQRLPLVVRGITKDGSKLVNVTIQAGTTEVDKAVADKIFPAVVHLVRNAVDHALETREVRKDSGKPETGELKIVCENASGTHLILRISDDGRGIDREAVARKAGQPVAHTDDELLSQICLAGLSTSPSLTHTSGRGMGMDIVRRTIEVLGGSLSLTTTAGEGTTITLKVPVSVTIVDVLSFVVGAQVFVAPVAIVDEIIEIDPGLVVDLPGREIDGARARLIQHRGRTIPLFVLDELLRREIDIPIPTKALIVNHNRGGVAFAIDRMLGKQEAVVRPLDDRLVRITGMAGATDLGDGRATLVLDLASLGGSLLKEPHPKESTVRA